MACMYSRNDRFKFFPMAFAFFLISSFIPLHFMGEARQLPNAHMIKGEEIGAKMRSMIGSRPPRCDQRCRNCGQCEAVQVPIAPAIKFMNREKEKKHGKNPKNTVEYSRGDDVSSYKPMCWKCKCGNFIFNP